MAYEQKCRIPELVGGGEPLRVLFQNFGEVFEQFLDERCDARAVADLLLLVAWISHVSTF